jgi:uncharacterized protein
MMKKLYILLLAIIPLAATSQDIPPPMEPPRMVNDFSQLLSDNHRAALEEKLQSFYYQTSNQIYVVILDDLQGYDKADFAFQLGEKWGIGTKGKDNGILILMNPSEDRMRGEVFIATGYGMEEFVPDAIANRIVDYDMIPYFKQQRYYDGLNSATSTIIELTEGAYTADEYIRKHSGSGGPGSVIGFILLFIIISSVIWGRRGGRGRSVGHNLPLWALLFMASGSRRSHSGGFGNFSSGGGSFGGFGGFGGGAGGSFGGGGAGGSW